eukprot:167864-Rhodomonas_salina.1
MPVHGIKAVSFVGSGHVGQIVYKAATANGKRAQCNMGAKVTFHWHSLARSLALARSLTPGPSCTP